MGADILFILNMRNRLAVICDGNDRETGNHRGMMLLIIRMLAL